jgi:superoxide dismutase
MKVFKLVTVSLLIAAQFVSAQFKQTPLPYAYNALEGSVDAQTMEIHYTKHAAGYVTNLNKAIAGTPLGKESLEKILSHISKENMAVRNNAGGHYNHELFWTMLTPEKNTQPSEKLAKAINESFGSLDVLKEKISKAGADRFGSDWAWLVVTPEKKLAITSTANQDNPLMDLAEIKGTPILGIDVWEHAYYLKYQNKRADYLAAIWNVLNWKEVSKRYEAATKGRFDDWQALKDFHGVMSQTFHPSEEGDLEPIKTRIGEMVTKAKALQTSKIPTEFNRKGLTEAMANLVKGSQNLEKKIKKKATDKEITESLSEIHDTFHTIIGLCTAEDKHDH